MRRRQRRLFAPVPVAAGTRRGHSPGRLFRRQESGVVHVRVPQPVLPGPARQQDVRGELHGRPARVQGERPEVHPVVLEVRVCDVTSRTDAEKNIEGRGKLTK